MKMYTKVEANEKKNEAKKLSSEWATASKESRIKILRKIIKCVCALVGKISWKEANQTEAKKKQKINISIHIYIERKL